MTRIFASILAASLLASSAGAAEMAVSIAGKSPDQIQADIHHAAVKVCNEELHDGGLLAMYYNQDSCVKASVKAALAQIPALPDTVAKASRNIELSKNK